MALMSYYVGMKKLNLVGQKFTRLTVIECAIASNIDRSVWLCKCDCGNTKIVTSSKLKNGCVKSCGCLNNEKRAERALIMSENNRKYTPSEFTARRIWRVHYSELFFEDFYELSQQNCYYCNSPPNNKQNAPARDKRAAAATVAAGDFIYNGLDRVDNTKAHTKENCVPCCKICNYAKRDLTTEEFKEWIIRIYSSFIGGNNLL